MMQHQMTELLDSTALLSNPTALRERYARDGYIFVHSVVDLEWISFARRCYIEVLAAQGLVKGDSDAPVWTGIRPAKAPTCDTLGDKVWSKFVTQPRPSEVVSEVLGEKAHWLPIVRHRCNLPSGPLTGDEDVTELRHQDGFFNAGLEFAICWMPIMDIPRDRGGLAIAGGLHNGGYLHDAVAPYKIAKGKIATDAWRTTHYRPGDLLIFDKAIPHTGLANHTDQVRLSMDIRVLPESAPRPIIGTVKTVDEEGVLIHTDEGEDVRVTVGQDTFIREMNPSLRVELGKVAYPGARVLAMTDGARRASVLRSIVY